MMPYGMPFYPSSPETDSLGLSPEEEALYLPDPQDYQVDPYVPQQYGRRSILESLAGLEGVDTPRPQSLGEGLLYGIGRGLGASGSRAAQRRQLFEQEQIKRQALNDQERILASRQLRADTGAGRRAIAGERLAAKKEQEKFNRENPPLTQAQIDASPVLKRAGYKAGDRPPSADLLRALTPIKPEQEPLVAIETPEGPRYVPRSQAMGKMPAVGQPKAARVTGADRQALAYFNRAKEASETITKPFDQSGLSLEDKMARQNVASGFQLQRAPGVALTPEQRAYRQAQRSFTEARLRKESGAAIPPHEYEADSQTYFAQPGDTPQIIAQKQAARDVVLQGLGFASGPAYEEFYGEPFPGAARAAPGAAQTRVKRPNVKVQPVTDADLKAEFDRGGFR